MKIEENKLEKSERKEQLDQKLKKINEMRNKIDKYMKVSTAEMMSEIIIAGRLLAEETQSQEVLTFIQELENDHEKYMGVELQKRIEEAVLPLEETEKYIELTLKKLALDKSMAILGSVIHESAKILETSQEMNDTEFFV